MLGGIQFSSPDLPDNDGYYHIRFALLMREEGLKPDFPWLPLTILNPREFYDHHFLFHVGLIPFTFGDLRIGAKLASVFFTSLAFLGVWRLLDSHQVPFSWLWSLGLLAVSSAFLYRMSITRAQSLSLLFLVMGLQLMFTRRYQWMAILGFFYVWLYDAFPLLPIIAGVYGMGVLIADGKFEWRPIFWALLGVSFGLLVNPYFPDNLVFIFRHLIPKLQNATSIRVGNEWYPYDTQQVMENSGFAFLTAAAGVVALALSEQRIERKAATSLLLVFLFGAMFFQARRFVEYFPAFTLMFAAFAWKPILERWHEGKSAGWTSPKLVQIRPQFVTFLGLMIFILIGMLRTLPRAATSIDSAKPYELFEGASDWLLQNTSPGTRVFQTDWDDFPRLFYYNTSNTYLIGLDPTYMELYDDKLYRLWENITNGDVEDLSFIIPTYFGSNYIVSDLNHKDFIQAARQDAGIEEVFRDEFSIVFRIK